MLKAGAIIIYGAEGVCKVTDVKKMSFCGGEEKDYYVIVPIQNQGSRLYVPLDNEHLTSKIMKLLSYEEIIELINTDTEKIEWLPDSKARSKYYKEILNSFDRKKIFALAKMLYNAKLGKIDGITKIYTVDEDILKKTSQFLYTEFSYVANITPDEVLPFICGEIVCKKKI